MSKAGTPCDLTIIILSLNEEIHIGRAVDSARKVAARVVVVDSGSTDRTRDIAQELGADVYFHPFSTHAEQLNWALDHTAIGTAWVMKLDSDEYLSAELVEGLPTALASAPPGVGGFTLNLRRVFMARWLRHGGLYPVRLLRIWRHGGGRAEARLMDEHVRVTGSVRHLDADFVDDNLNTLSWWTEKHNRYASREAAVLLDLEYGFLPATSSAVSSMGGHAGVKRWVKEHIYARLPGGLRAVLYFMYRYVLRLGFLDGKQGAVFHVLQAFWYRYLVDSKIYEVKSFMKAQHVPVAEAVEKVLGVHVPHTRTAA